MSPDATTAIKIQVARVIELSPTRLVDGLAEERCVRTEEQRAALPAGTITIGADDCCAVAVGDGTFTDTRLPGSYPAAESVLLPAYIVAAPGLPVVIPGGSTVLHSQEEADAVRDEFHAVDASGTLFSRDSTDDFYERFAWFTAGRDEPVQPAFPVTAWY